jgi:hypothetical protein
LIVFALITVSLDRFKIVFDENEVGLSKATPCPATQKIFENYERLPSGSFSSGGWQNK